MSLSMLPTYGYCISDPEGRSTSRSVVGCDLHCSSDRAEFGNDDNPGAAPPVSFEEY
ncbi:MAG: hypothetical protein QOG10_5093 [Kribbellaceae bacterium]|jgi:hypothetical protein|nr:hypothetical protein [Kribbellaceae bacterium]